MRQKGSSQTTACGSAAALLLLMTKGQAWVTPSCHQMRAGQHMRTIPQLAKMAERLAH